MSVVFPAPFSPRRAWTCPGATERLIPSLATRGPYLLVMPLSSSSTYRRPRLDRALGRRLDASALDAGLNRLQLGLQRGRDRAGEVVERREHGAAVGERADVGAALERAGRRRRHRALDRGLDALGDAADHVLAVLRGADAAVGVDPEHVDVTARAVRVLDRLGGAQAHVARDREDDVRALADERLGDRLALGLVGEVAGELALLCLLVPAEDLDVGVVLLVVVLDPVPVAVHVDRDGPEVLTAERGDLAGLAHAGGQVTAEEAVLHGVERQLVDVALLGAGQALRGVRAVDDREVLARVRLGRALRRRGHQEADGDDDPALLGQERVDVRHVLALRGGLQVLHRDVRVGSGGLLHALPGRLVERLVVDAAGVGDHAAEELGGRRRARAAARRARAGARGTRRARGGRAA